MAFKAPSEFCKRPHIYTLGADPEFFVMDGDELAPAFAFLPPKGNNRTHFWDGFQAEFIHQEVVSCIGLHGCETHKGLATLLDIARKQIGEHAKISLVNTLKVPQKMLEHAADPHVEFGCMPSENAYDMRGKHIENPREMPWRFAGGHMHFGGFPLSFNRHKALAKALDAVVGVWGVAMAEDLDNPIRREYYGLAGEYRPTKYKEVPRAFSHIPIYEASGGIEYRTLSNFYFCHPAIHQLAWEVARFAVVFFELGYIDMWAATEDEVIDTINTCNVKQARAILKRNEPMMMWAFTSTFFASIEAKKAIQMPYKGIKHYIRRPNDIARNWRLADIDCSIYADFITKLSFKAFAEE